MNVHLPSVEQLSKRRSSCDLIESAQRLAETIFASASTADADAVLSDHTFDALWASGLTRAPFSKEANGHDLLAADSAIDLCLILSLIGSADLSVARIFEGHVNAVALVSRYGSGPQVQRFSDDVAAGAMSGVWGADDAKGLRAAPIDGGWRLEGKKILASGAGALTRPLVTATSDEGQVIFLLHLNRNERADVSGWQAQGMRASATGTVDLTGLILTPDQLVGTPGDFMRQPYFSGGAWRFCAVHLGAMEKLVDLFRAHLVSRKRDSDPYQIQRVAQCIASTTTARIWVEKSARCLSQQRLDSDSIVALVNMTRMVTERAALDVLEAVHRGVGLLGFIRPSPVERISRDLATYLRQPVPDLAMANAAKWALGSARPTAQLWADDEV